MHGGPDVLTETSECPNHALLNLYYHLMAGEIQQNHVS
jgi:hypothetical protein